MRSDTFLSEITENIEEGLIGGYFVYGLKLKEGIRLS
jgi:hypothetical protein